MPVKITEIPLNKGDTFTICNTANKITIEVTSTSIKELVQNDIFFKWVLSVSNKNNQIDMATNRDNETPVKPPVSTYLLIDYLNKAYSVKCKHLSIIRVNNKDIGYDYNYYLSSVRVGESITVERISKDNKTLYYVKFTRCEFGWWVYEPLLINARSSVVDQPVKKAGMFRVWLSKQNRWMDDVPVQEALVFKEEGYVVQRMDVSYTTPPA